MRAKQVMLLFLSLTIIACETISGDKPEKLTSNATENFYYFFEEFKSDSNFQYSRVVDSLITEIQDYEGNKEYLFIPWQYDNFSVGLGQEFEFIFETAGPNEKTIRAQGIDNGIMVFYNFKLVNGCWFLVGIEDAST